MTKSLKYFVYIAGSVFIFTLIIKGSFATDTGTNKATAFEWERKVNIYFSDLSKVSTSDCSALLPVSRMVLNAETLGPGAIEALLEGPTDVELQSGYGTSIPKGVLIQKFDIRNRVAYVDFNSKLNEGVAGSCNVAAIRSEIEKTLTSLPDIDSVVISVNDQTEAILEP